VSLKKDDRVTNEVLHRVKEEYPTDHKKKEG
jgi:hypothetical protein